MTFHLAEIVAPADSANAPSWVVAGMIETSFEAALFDVGHDDFVESADEILARMHDTRQRRRVAMVALRGERPAGSPDGPLTGFRAVRADADENEPGHPSDVLGGTTLHAPVLDNLHLVEADHVEVRPAERGHGIDEALLDAIEVAARALDRDTVIVWVNHSRGITTDVTASVADPTGMVRLAMDDPVVALYVGRGFRLAQGERHSVCPVPVPDEAATALDLGDRLAADGYSIVSWDGATPVELRGALAELRIGMSTDVPTGEVDYREEQWDSERIATDEAASLRSSHLITSVARQDATGELVGYTMLSVPFHKDQIAFQNDTLVQRDHRGHRLGTALKLANARLLAERFPAVSRIHTWNADENDHMLRINYALGYRTENLEGSWQKRL